jgi:hypothetical protein
MAKADGIGFSLSENKLTNALSGRELRAVWRERPSLRPARRQPAALEPGTLLRQVIRHAPLGGLGCSAKPEDAAHDTGPVSSSPSAIFRLASLSVSPAKNFC